MLVTLMVMKEVKEVRIRMQDCDIRSASIRANKIGLYKACSDSDRDDPFGITESGTGIELSRLAS